MRWSPHPVSSTLAGCLSPEGATMQKGIDLGKHSLHVHCHVYQLDACQNHLSQ